jgi:hypothetical protein
MLPALIEGIEGWTMTSEGSGRKSAERLDEWTSGMNGVDVPIVWQNPPIHHPGLNDK